MFAKITAQKRHSLLEIFLLPVTEPTLLRDQLNRVVVAFSSLASILGECSTIHSVPAPFFFFKVEVNSKNTNSTFYARISPKWLIAVSYTHLTLPTSDGV